MNSAAPHMHELPSEPMQPASAVPASPQMLVNSTAQPPLFDSTAAAPENSSALRGGGGKFKLPNLPKFSGDRNSSTPKATRQWLSQMQIALRQDRDTDPVMFAVTHLIEDAADWRDVMFLYLYPVITLIPWVEFEKAFLQRFVPL